MRFQPIVVFATLSALVLFTACHSKPTASHPVTEKVVNFDQNKATKDADENRKTQSSTKSKPFTSDDITIRLHQVENEDRFHAFYQNYMERKPDQIRVIAYTIEGDPIYTSVEIMGNDLRVTYDNSKDYYGGPKAGKQTFTCSAIAERPHYNGTFYELQKCTGHNDQIGDTLFLIAFPTCACR